MSLHAKTDRLSRRQIVVGAGAGALLGVATPGVLRAQTRELVVGGAASHKPWVETYVVPLFEKKYNAKINFEGTRSLVNLEKMQKNKDRPYLSVVQMDDPVMILAVREGLLEPITVAKAPNVAKLKPGTFHMDGQWANYLQPWQGIAYNTNVIKRRRPPGPSLSTRNTRRASSCRRCRTPRGSRICSSPRRRSLANRWRRR